MASNKFMPEVTYESGDRIIDAYLSGDDSDKGIILITDVFGYKYDDMRRIADLLAQNGYVVLVPDVLRGNPLTFNFDMSKIDEWRASHPKERVLKDIENAVKYIKSKVNKIGITGFCWGGLQTFNASQMGLFDAAVDFYGARMDTKTASNVKCPILAIFGKDDPSIPMEQVEQLKKELKDSNIIHKVKVFPDCGHAFVQKRDKYNEPAANEALQDMLNWFNQYLS